MWTWKSTGDVARGIHDRHDAGGQHLWRPGTAGTTVTICLDTEYRGPCETTI